MEYDWGVIINFKKESEANARFKRKNQVNIQTKVIVDLLLNVVAEESQDSGIIPNPCPEDQVNEVLLRS